MFLKIRRNLFPSDRVNSWVTGKHRVTNELRPTPYPGSHFPLTARACSWPSWGCSPNSQGFRSVEGVDPVGEALWGDPASSNLFHARCSSSGDSQHNGPPAELPQSATQTAANSTVTAFSGTCQGLLPTEKVQDKVLILSEAEVEKGWPGAGPQLVSLKVTVSSGWRCQPHPAQWDSA